MAATTIARRPILYHYFKNPLQYNRGLALQETLVARRIESKTALTEPEKLSSKEHETHERIAAQDVLLLLQHTPVYTAGRRETDESTLAIERERLTAIGADYIATQRGGQTTYHGPGQLVGYPILDIAAMDLSTKYYVDRISKFLDKLLIEKLEIPLLLPAPQVGAFPSSTSKIASIGMQIRKRISSHGFSLNVQDDVKYWFDQIIACGSPDIKATSIESELRRLGRLGDSRPTVEDLLPTVVKTMSEVMQRSITRLEESDDAALQEIVREAEEGKS